MTTTGTGPPASRRRLSDVGGSETSRTPSVRLGVGSSRRYRSRRSGDSTLWITRSNGVSPMTASAPRSRSLAWGLVRYDAITSTVQVRPRLRRRADGLGTYWSSSIARQDATTRLPIHLRMVVQHPRRGRAADAGASGDVVDRGHGASAAWEPVPLDGCIVKPQPAGNLPTTVESSRRSALRVRHANDHPPEAAHRARGHRVADRHRRVRPARRRPGTARAARRCRRRADRPAHVRARCAQRATVRRPARDAGGDHRPTRHRDAGHHDADGNAAPRP